MPEPDIRIREALVGTRNGWRPSTKVHFRKDLKHMLSRDRDPEFCLLEDCGQPVHAHHLCERHDGYYRPRCPECGKIIKTEISDKRGVCSYCYGCMGEPRRRKLRERMGRGGEVVT